MDDMPEMPDTEDFDPMNRENDPGIRVSKGKHAQAIEAARRKQRVVELMHDGATLAEALADPKVAVVQATYKKWRQRDPHFAANVDRARAGTSALEGEWNGSRASFFQTFFGMAPAAHQIIYLNEIDKAAPGSIVLVLWPPEHGKTTTFENQASMDFALDPNWRITVASESKTISGKILGRVKNRMEPGGPFPAYVRRYGPFKPPTGQGRAQTLAQPWGAHSFNVFKKATHDERDFNMLAIGWKSSTVSIRTDHLHCDDLQSVKTAGQTDAIEDWFRQDALSRPGEYGKTSLAGTRVGDDDIYERIENDPELGNILKVVKFRAIRTDPLTGEQHALWPERYNLDQLDRMRRKVGQEAWDRNYMQAPGISKTNRTFTKELVDQCKDPNLSLQHPVTPGRIVYVGLDPALGGANVVLATEISPEGKMIVRRVLERSGLQRNEEIMADVEQVVRWCNLTGRVTDVVVETKNFQLGLAHDERFLEMRDAYGFQMREHLTGWNKYDENVGVPSMASSFRRKEIVIPWAADDLTRGEMGELCRQLAAWKPMVKGNKLRQDRVMALWFCWILWQERHKAADSRVDPSGWKRKALPYGSTQTGLIVPIGAIR